MLRDNAVVRVLSSYGSGSAIVVEGADSIARARPLSPRSSGSAQVAHVALCQASDRGVLAASQTCSVDICRAAPGWMSSEVGNALL